jgi:antitoxin component of MazEF toxin-antitoxin module
MLVIKPQKKSRLESLISQINSENLHNEISTGRSIGNEKW